MNQYIARMNSIYLKMHKSIIISCTKKIKYIQLQKFGKMMMLNMHNVSRNDGKAGNVNLLILQKQSN